MGHRRGELIEPGEIWVDFKEEAIFPWCEHSQVQML